MVFVLAGVAGAIPYTDTVSPHTYMRGSLFGHDDSISWTFDITDDGFNPSTQDVTSASVALNLRDDGRDFFEFARLDVGANRFFWEVDNGDISFTIRSLMTLSDTGTVNATLTASYGDFLFKSAKLTAQGTGTGSDIDTSAVPVPEPSTMLLMSTGILGLVAYGRKRFNQKA